MCALLLPAFSTLTAVFSRLCDVVNGERQAHFLSSLASRLDVSVTFLTTSAPQQRGVNEDKREGGVEGGGMLWSRQALTERTNGNGSLIKPAHVVTCTVGLMQSHTWK